MPRVFAKLANAARRLVFGLEAHWPHLVIRADKIRSIEEPVDVGPFSYRAGQDGPVRRSNRCLRDRRQPLALFLPVLHHRALLTRCRDTDGLLEHLARLKALFPEMRRTLKNCSASSEQCPDL